MLKVIEFSKIIGWKYHLRCTKMFSIKDFLKKIDQIRRKLRILPHLLKKSLMGNFIFCAVLSIFCVLDENGKPSKKIVKPNKQIQHAK